ncbi:hypothetical protein BJY52DRAFT_1333172 [Lactarius psammicola]|nr:hypothetical protein BJY52DRAFT_1333172 [Lactarius psammicola]
MWFPGPVITSFLILHMTALVTQGSAYRPTRVLVQRWDETPLDEYFTGDRAYVHALLVFLQQTGAASRPETRPTVLFDPVKGESATFRPRAHAWPTLRFLLFSITGSYNKLSFFWGAPLL